MELDAPLTTTGGEEMDRYNLFASDDPSPLDILLEKEKRDILRTAMKIVSPRDERILVARFGLRDDNDRTLDQAGVPFGICRERVRQLQNTAFRRLKRHTLLRELREKGRP